MFYRWEATVYKQFAGMDWADAKQMLGSYSAWPKDSPPKVFKQDVATDIPDSFDAREKWPGSIHAIRNQVTFNCREQSFFIGNTNYYNSSNIFACT